jgi:hypothetical protein
VNLANREREALSPNDAARHSPVCSEPGQGGVAVYCRDFLPDRAQMQVRPARPLTDISTDPFHERIRAPRFRAQLLGAQFEFETDSRELRHLIEWAYAGVPPHRLPGTASRVHVKLVLTGSRGRKTHSSAPKIDIFSGAELLGGASERSSLAIISPSTRSAVIVVSQAMLRFPHEVRYELIEFAVSTLAARIQRLVPLHAACVGRDDRGLVLIGGSGAGKSTASLHCLLAGMEFVSEDSLLVTCRTLRATGVANFLHVRRESLRFLPRLRAAALSRSPTIRRRSGVQKLEVDLRHTGFRLARAPLKIAGIVFLSPEAAGNGPLCSPLGSDDARRRLIETQPYAAGQSGWAQFSRRVARLPAYELRRGRHPSESVAALDRILSAGTRRTRGPSRT